MSQRVVHRILNAILFLSAILVYLRTLGPDIGAGGNHGELTASAWLLGNCHPTGYPVYQLLARFAMMLPFGAIAMRINLFSAISCAIAGSLLALTLRTQAVSTPPRLIAFSMVVFNPLIWHQAVLAEVYGLNLMFWVGLFFLFLKISESPARFCPLFFFIIGLAMGNHGLILFLAGPMALVLLIRNRLSLKVAIPALILAISTYLYLPLRAQKITAVNWGNPGNAYRFVRIVTGRQFQSEISDRYPGEITYRIQQTLKQLSKDIPWYAWTLAFLGLINLLRRDRYLVAIGIASGLSVFGFLILYGIYDIHEYNGPIYLLLAFFSALGADWLHKALKQNSVPGSTWISLGFSLIIFLHHFTMNFSYADCSSDYVSRDYGRLLLDSVPHQGGVLFKGDNPSNTLTYLQVIEWQRPDVVAWDANGSLLRNPHNSSNRNLQNHYADIYRLMSIHPPPLLFTYKDDLEKNFGLGFRSFGILYYPEVPRITKVMEKSREPTVELKLSTRMCLRPYAAERELLAEFSIQQADASLDRADRIGASDKLSQALLYGSDLAHIHSVVGSRLWALDRRDQAIKIMTRSLTLNPFSPDTWNNYSWFLVQTGEKEGKAIEAANRAVSMEPENPAFRHTRGKALLLSGDLEGAIADFKFVVDRVPGYRNDLTEALALRESLGP